MEVKTILSAEQIDLERLSELLATALSRYLSGHAVDRSADLRVCVPMVSEKQR